MVDGGSWIRCGDGNTKLKCFNRVQIVFNNDKMSTPASDRKYGAQKIRLTST